jgi:hypothetical protein
MGCRKIWARWPGSDKNMDLLLKYNNLDQKFIALWDQLEGGSFTTTNPDEVIYLKPGDIHATLTLEGGLTPGVEYYSAESVEKTFAFWKRERQDVTWFLKSCKIGLSHLEHRELTAHVLCPAIRQHPEMWQSEELKGLIEAEELEGTHCPTCSEHWDAHTTEYGDDGIARNPNESEYEEPNRKKRKVKERRTGPEGRQKTKRIKS